MGLGPVQAWAAGGDDACSQRSHGRGAAGNTSSTVGGRCLQPIQRSRAQGCVPCDSPYVTFWKTGGWETAENWSVIAEVEEGLTTGHEGIWG